MSYKFFFFQCVSNEVLYPYSFKISWRSIKQKSCNIVTKKQLKIRYNHTIFSVFSNFINFSETQKQLKIHSSLEIRLIYKISKLIRCELKFPTNSPKTSLYKNVLNLFLYYLFFLWRITYLNSYCYLFTHKLIESIKHHFNCINS